MRGVQLALLGREPARFDPERLRALRRHDLDETAWVEHLPAWVEGHSALFELIERTAPWAETTQVLYDQVVATPRLVATLEDTPTRWPLVAELARALSAHYGVTFDAITAALYRDGNDSVAWHRDRNLRTKEHGFVATVSLGESRPFVVRRRGGGPTVVRYALGGGDLCVMGGTCQRDWEHAVPKQRGARGPRIVLMFRHHEALPALAHA